MRKWLYLMALVVVIGLLSTAYYITGIKAQQEFHTFLKSANNIPNLTVEALDYQRGWLKSTVKLHVTLHRPEQQIVQKNATTILPAQDIAFTFDTKLYHGPIIIADKSIMLGLGYAKTKIPLPEQMIKEFDTLFTSDSTKPNLCLSLLLKFRDKLLIRLSIPSFKLYAKESNNGQLEWKGINSAWKLSSDLKQIKGKLKFHGMVFKNDQTNGEVKPIKIYYNVYKHPNNLLSGKIAFHLDGLKFNMEDKKQITVEKVNIVSKSHLDNERVNSSLKVNLDKATVDEKTYGPGKLKIVLRNLDAKTLSEIQNQLQTITNGNLTDSQRQLMVLVLLPKLPKLVEKGAQFEVKTLKFNLPEGVIDAKANVSLPDITTSDTSKTEVLMMNNPMQLINQIQANADISLPSLWLKETLAALVESKIRQHQITQQQLVQNDEEVNSNSTPQLLSDQEMAHLAKEKADNRIANWVKNGILIEKNGTYQLNIVFKNGSLTVNDKPFTGTTLQ